MTQRFVCIHGHFYQPPRENPWLEEIEPQPSAHPYHDWNERITAECYAPMAHAGNYARMSFNFGPTLLSWMERKQPRVYQGILEAEPIPARGRPHSVSLFLPPLAALVQPIDETHSVG